VTTSYGRVEGLPEPETGVLYLVSAVVRAAVPGRADVASPGDLVRDGEGNVIGCRHLILNAPPPAAAPAARWTLEGLTSRYAAVFRQEIGETDTGDVRSYAAMAALAEIFEHVDSCGSSAETSAEYLLTDATETCALLMAAARRAANRLAPLAPPPFDDSDPVRDGTYRKEAIRRCHRDGIVEIDNDAHVLWCPEGNGAYVTVQIFIDDAMLPGAPGCPSHRHCDHTPTCTCRRCTRTCGCPACTLSDDLARLAFHGGLYDGPPTFPKDGPKETP